MGWDRQEFQLFLLEELIIVVVAEYLLYVELDKVKEFRVHLQEFHVIPVAMNPRQSFVGLFDLGVGGK